MSTIYSEECKNLIKFWKEISNKKENESKIHHQDIQSLKKASIDIENELINDLRPNSLENIVAIEKKSTAFHNQMIPVPYVGDVQNAKIFYLTGNPGYEHADYFNNQHTSGLINELRNNLIQENLDKDYPFFCLNPKYSHTGGYRYWMSRLKKLRAKMSIDLKMSQTETLEFLGKNLAVLELTGYPSKSMNHNIINNLESKRLITEFVDKDLVKRKDVLILFARSSNLWNLNDILKKNIQAKTYEFNTGQSRGGYISDNIINKSGIIEFIRKHKL